MTDTSTAPAALAKGDTTPTAEPPDKRRLPGVPDLLLALAAVVLLVFLFRTDGFFTRTSLVALLSTSAITGIIAIGMTVIALSGNVLSFALGVTASVTTLVCLATLRHGPVVAIVLSLLVGAAIFAVQGLLVGAFGTNPVIIAVGSLAAISGAAIEITGGASVQPSGDGTDWLNGKAFGIPVVFVIFFLLAVVGQAVLSGTTFGRRLMLVGSNRSAAEAAGQPVSRVILLTYMAAGACAAITGVLLAARYGATGFSQSQGGGVQYDYDAIAAVLVGGTSLRGGRGAIWRTVLGVILVEALSNALLLHGFSTQTRQLTNGVIVAVALVLSDLRSRSGVRR